uniref:N protein n=1 Tax=Apis rhabdovirus 1 TaxID=1983567 RepID=A0A8K1J6D7_9RHAB|nr:N protein [Apis rhabdovirus 1]
MRTFSTLTPVGIFKAIMASLSNSQIQALAKRLGKLSASETQPTPKNFEVDSYLSIPFICHVAPTVSIVHLLTAVTEGLASTYRVAQALFVESVKSKIGTIEKGPTSMTIASFTPPVPTQEVIAWVQENPEHLTEDWILAFAAYLVGWSMRKTGRANQIGKFCGNIEKILNISGPTLSPEIINGMLRLPQISSTDYDIHSTLTHSLLLLDNTDVPHWEAMMFYALYRPICSQSTVLSRRYAEFTKLLPTAFESENYLTNGDFKAGMIALLEYWGAIEKCNLSGKTKHQPMVTRTLDTGFFSDLSRMESKRMSAALLYCICLKSDRMADFEAFKSAGYSATVHQAADEVHLKRWVEKMSSEDSERKFAGFFDDEQEADIESLLKV